MVTILGTPDLEVLRILSSVIDQLLILPLTVFLCVKEAFHIPLFSPLIQQTKNSQHTREIDLESLSEVKK